ncbi:MAG: ATP-binding protein [Bacteroidetes bacterium]|nr:ATP-binding protein [Bacteroidota bacterium]
MRKLSYIESLIEQGESQSLDFKYNINDSRKIAKSLVAFSNTNGGTLLVGIRDNGSIAGITSDEELFMLEAAANFYSRPEIEFDSKIWRLDHKNVLEVKISASPIKPHFAENEDKKWMAYIRVNDNNILANKVLLKVWEREQGQMGIYLKYRKREEMLLKALEQNREMNFKQVQNHIKLPKYIVENILANLICLDVIEMNIYEDKFTYSLREDGKLIYKSK